MDILQDETERQIAAKLCKENPSNRDIGLALMLVIGKMWSEERLAEYIHQVHDSLCANCPHVRGEPGKMSGKLIALIGSLVAAVCSLTGAVVMLASR